ncbi:uncharacterized protein LOC131830563 isoform X2 [Mustela lutreola]|uniref:uncharacterized protein LOC131830563 isoform X2 n=1 Tax=Mustela lutreola TaxID=9666 RepID=UPI0027971938|nr:uncharacterized protein LOC131830563 isoform X2 [Mustela lutreola]
MTFVTCTGLSCTNHLQQQRGLWRVGGHRTGPSHGTFLCFGFSIRYHYNDHRHRKGCLLTPPHLQATILKPKKGRMPTQLQETWGQRREQRKKQNPRTEEEDKGDFEKAHRSLLRAVFPEGSPMRSARGREQLPFQGAKAKRLVSASTSANPQTHAWKQT